MKKIIGFIISVAMIISLFSFSSEAAGGTWKQSGGGWWYEYADGSYAQSEYIDGYWLNSSGWYDSAWNGSWTCNSSGWWFESGSWYPSNQWLKIDGSWYYFKADGYMAVNEWIGDYFLGADGAWVPGAVKDTGSNNNNSNVENNNTDNTKQNTAKTDDTAAKKENQSNNDSKTDNKKDNAKTDNNQSNDNTDNSTNNTNEEEVKECKHEFKELYTLKYCTKFSKVKTVCRLCGYYGDFYDKTAKDAQIHHHIGEDKTTHSGGLNTNFQTKWEKCTVYHCTKCEEWYEVVEDYKWNCSTDGHLWCQYGGGSVCVRCGARKDYPNQSVETPILPTDQTYDAD